MDARNPLILKGKKKMENSQNVLEPQNMNSFLEEKVVCVFWNRLLFISFSESCFFFQFEYFVGVLWGILVRDFFRQTAKWRKKKKNKWTST